MEDIFRYFFFATVGFFSGSVMYSYLIPRLVKKVDVREGTDDGNPGTANAMKKAGVPCGICCLLCDMLKAYLPVFFAIRHLDYRAVFFAIVLAGPVVGHVFSPFLGFHGGKGIAAAFGVLIALLPYSPAVFVLCALYIFFSVIVILRPHALRTLVTFVLYSAFALWKCPPGIAWGSVLLSSAVCYRHLMSARASAHRQHGKV